MKYRTPTAPVDHDWGVPIEMPQGERKYTSEFSLIVAVQGTYLLRAQDLHRVPVETLDQDHPCHLYVISRTPRVSIEPESITISKDVIRGVVSIHFQGETEDHGFAVRHDFGPGTMWKSSWPHEEFAILDQGGNQIRHGVGALLGGVVDGWPQRAAVHEILYVGQAYGSDGERTAWDRLRCHETLQKILGDQDPDTQVWLTMAAICDVQLLQEVSPHGGCVTDEFDKEHTAEVLKKIHCGGFQDREAVALAEAGLIRGWGPEYNDRLKYKFPARKQVSLETARGLDLHGLIVEWQSVDLPSLYFCQSQRPGKMFFFGYEVHLEKGRAETLSLRDLRTPLVGGRGLPNLYR